MNSRTLSLCALALFASVAFAATAKLDAATLSKMSTEELYKLKAASTIPDSKLAPPEKTAIDDEMRRRVEAFNKANLVPPADQNKANDEARCVNKSPVQPDGERAPANQNPELGTWMPGPGCLLR